MAGNYWEDAVYSLPPLDSLERIDMSAAFDWMKSRFPIDAGRIDWLRVGGKHAHWRIDDDELLTSRAIREVCDRIHPGSVVEHIGDGLSPYGVRFGDSDSTSVARALLEVPENHYFIAGDRTWIVAVAMEGDLDVVDQFNL